MCVSICEGEDEDDSGKIRLLTTDEQVFRGRSVRSTMLLLLLLLLPPGNAVSDTLPEWSAGQKFVIVFPENIAYYHPTDATNKIQITALHNDTTVNIIMSTYDDQTEGMKAGDTLSIDITKEMELRRMERSNDTLRISSTKDIAVHTINQKSNSVQTAVVIPTDKLGTMYFIPLPPHIDGTTVPQTRVTRDVTERGPFRVLIVNTDKLNTVTYGGSASKTVSLRPYEIAQILSTETNQLHTVQAQEPVAVLFGHPCAIQQNCTCGQLYTMLPPAKAKKLKFYIPTVLAKNVQDNAAVLLSNNQESILKDFDPTSAQVETTNSAIFYRPGLLLTLIPEKDFASCYVVHPLFGTQNYVVIVVHRGFKDGVHVNEDRLVGPEWEELKGTEYVSTLVELAPLRNSVIWHTSYKMAVYFVGRKESAWFGNPAAIISTTPDFRGCIITPEVLTIGPEASGWRESLKYCKDNNLELISFPEVEFQRQIYRKLQEEEIDDILELWIGMRLSTPTGKWYWLDESTIKNTNWEEGQPGSVNDGQCAIMSLEKGKNFGWRSEDCCKAARPICYSKPELFPFPPP